ncbi:sensor domain-containing diguanylate cyclase [Noviherbaspirillum aridicola]|uniref:GGDEF domain-containing protein n=1 Tax=Noviherbaspirillum aridicola TaxID=2849687 RepID=A0ABQ4Q9G6_9BURK|nr:sensor domain-containing diguanylate cyclase [Noviherbaspirillum aridicola]GIZ53709.1 hypothetical protein NCCP691_37230 [Noviherbaspirillum aridicola]
MYWHNYTLERRSLVQGTISTTRHLAQLVDAKLQTAVAVLEALAVLPSLRSGNLDNFLLDSIHGGPPEWLAGLAVTDLKGRVLYDSTHRNYEWASWDRKYYVDVPTVPKISEPYLGGFAQEPVVAVTVPVEVRGEHVLNLTGLVRVQEFTKLHLALPVPDSWLVSIVDEHGHIISRTTNLPQYFRMPGNASLLSAMGGSDEGLFNGATVDGRRVLGVFSRAASSRWVVAIGIPAEDLATELRLRLVLSSIALLLATAVAVVAVWVVARKIALTVRELRTPALALGRGETPALPQFYFKEAEEVGSELLRAADLLQSAQHRANHDALTGLPNRVLFKHLTDQQLAVAQRTNAPFSVLFIDLDGFKKVNDSLGHQAGDELLIQVAQRMRTQTRAADAVSRHGGDEFAVLLFGAGSDDGVQVAEGLLDAISFPYRISGQSCLVSASIGVATYPLDGITTEALLQKADTAMYVAKARGKHRVVAASKLSLDENKKTF